MEKKEKIVLLLKENKIEELNKFNKNSMFNILLQILEEEFLDFNYENDIDYLKNLIKILPKYQDTNQKKFYERIKLIHQKIKINLVQKPGNIEKIIIIIKY